MPLNEYEPGTTFPGVIGRTTDESSPAWPAAAARERGSAERAVHRAGRHRLRAAGLLRQPDRDAEPGRAGRGRAALQQHAHHRAVLAVALLHHHRPQPPLQRHGVRSPSSPPATPATTAHPVRERLPLRDAAAAGLQHLHGRQVPPDARRSSSPRPAPTTAGRSGAASSASTASSAATPASGTPTWSTTTTRSSRRHPGGGLPPDRGPGRQGHRVHRRRQAGRPGQAVLPALLHRRDARAAPRAPRSGPTATRASSTTAGTPTGSACSPARRSWASAGRRGAVPARPGRAGVGLALAGARRLAARMMEVFAGFLSHTDHHIGRCSIF